MSKVFTIDECCVFNFCLKINYHYMIYYISIYKTFLPIKVTQWDGLNTKLKCTNKQFLQIIVKFLFLYLLYN